MIPTDSLSQESSSPLYFVQINGTVYGPYTMQQVNEMTRSGQIAADTMICVDGMTEWVRYADMQDKMLTGPSSEHADTSSPLYFVQINGTVYGPYTMQQLNEMTRSGQIAADTMICVDGMTEWVRYADMQDKMPTGPSSEHTDTSSPHNKSVKKKSILMWGKNLYQNVRDIISEIRKPWQDINVYKQFLTKLSNCSLISPEGRMSRSSFFWMCLLGFIPLIFFQVLLKVNIEYLLDISAVGNRLRGLVCSWHADYYYLILFVFRSCAAIFGLCYIVLFILFLIGFAFCGKAAAGWLNPIKWTFKADVFPLLLKATASLLRVLLQFSFIYIVHIMLFSYFWRKHQDTFIIPRVGWNDQTYYDVNVVSAAPYLTIPLFAFFAIAVIKRFRDAGVPLISNNRVFSTKFIFVVVYGLFWLFPFVAGALILGAGALILPIYNLVNYLFGDDISLLIAGCTWFAIRVWLLYKFISIGFRATQTQSSSTETFSIPSK